MANLTPEEERILRKLLSKQRRGKSNRRRQPVKKQVDSFLVKNGVAEVLLLIIALILVYGLISQ